MSNSHNFNETLESFLEQCLQKQKEVVSREEFIERQREKELLNRVAEYTVDKIVNRIGALQLEFNSSIQEISQRLSAELNILVEIRKAIYAKQREWENITKINLVADGLYVFKQQAQEKLKALEDEYRQQIKTIESQREILAQQWQQEEREFVEKITEEQTIIQQKRNREESDYNYEIQRARERQMDEYENKKRIQEIEIATLQEEKEKNWRERETILALQEEEFNLNQQKVATFEEIIKTETNKARGEAIKEIQKEYETKTIMREKEWEAIKQGYEFRLQSLQAKIQQQNEQMQSLNQKLQEVILKTQTLALKAFDKTQ